MPDLVKYSKPASRSRNSVLGIVEPNARIASLAAYTANEWSFVTGGRQGLSWKRTGMTSWPIPSAGSIPMRSFVRAVVRVRTLRARE